MGEVYRAHDTKLKRQIAIKVLPVSMSADPDRLQRFQREAEVLACLNHPHIATVYGLEHVDGVQALVMELVEGEDLAQRLTRGPRPLDEALRLGKQIAEALEAAHERGIIHRDLKPANIKVRPDGSVKVLDFGLAKAIEPAGTSGVSGAATITTPGMTRAGTILGTAAYMSPEQARGQSVDKRSDVWSFGCVLYEMLTGTRPFEGDDVSEALASVLAREPDWSRLPPAVKPSLSTYIRRCLERNPKQRIADVQDVRLALEGAFDTSPPATSRKPTRNLAAVLALVALVSALASGLVVWNLKRADGVPRVTRLQMPLPPGQNFYFNGRHIVAISPTGTQVAFSAGLGLWLRSLDQLQAKPIP